MKHTNYGRSSFGIVCAVVVVCAAAVKAGAQVPVPPVANPCPRPAAGTVVTNPPSLFSRNGVLGVDFSYQTTIDADGRKLFCFMTPAGLQNPTLYVEPGDHLMIKVTNNTPASSVQMAVPPPNCGATGMTGSSMNIHYHGTNTSPVCGQDEVIHTTINSGETFQYDVAFPLDEPPGLYWYHPHVHGLAEAAVQGGASGAIVVAGLQNIQPAVAGLRQRVLVIRDQNVAGGLPPGGPVPSWDLTINNVPIAYPALTPAVLRMDQGEKQLWRVTNSTADSILDLQVQFDGVPQVLQIVGLDGVPTGSQEGTRQGQLVRATHVRMPTAGRAEFIVSAPPSGTTEASLVTLAINTGPLGDNDTKRTLATIDTSTNSATSRDGGNDDAVPSNVGAPWKQRFEGLRNATPTATRKLYFSEVLSDPNNPLSPTNFFITVDGATPVVFDPNHPPAIVTTQGSVEQWTIENRAQENHEFHMHQIHFLVESQNHFEVNGSRPVATANDQYLDMIEVPFWDGDPTHPYPSVTLRMDFRGPDIGDFVYHCHILGHEDNGMMAIIRVQPASAAARGPAPASSTPADAHQHPTSHSKAKPQQR
jgi:FtsP/CotA-like multicopper oxidase with cupredoxin domain